MVESSNRDPRAITERFRRLSDVIGRVGREVVGQRLSELPAQPVDDAIDVADVVGDDDEQAEPVGVAQRSHERHQLRIGGELVGVSRHDLVPDFPDLRHVGKLSSGCGRYHSSSNSSR